MCSGKKVYFQPPMLQEGVMSIILANETCVEVSGQERFLRVTVSLSMNFCFLLFLRALSA